MAIVQYRSGRVSYVSPNIERLWGYPAEAIAADRNLWFDCLHPDDRERSSEVAAQAHQERRPKYRFEYRLRCNDGIYRWFESAVSLQYAPDGSTAAFTAFVFDISESKHLQEQQRMRAQVGMILSSSLVLADMLRELAVMLSSELGDICYLALNDPDQEASSSPVYRPEALADRGEFLDDRALWLNYRVPFDRNAQLRSRIQAGEPVYVDLDVADSFAEFNDRPDQINDYRRRIGARWLLVQPVVAEGATIGILVLVARRENFRSRAEILQCTASIAWRLALAIENARLYAAADSAMRRLDTLIEHLPSAVIVTDRRGRPIRMNEAARGWSRELPPGRDSAPVPLDVCDPDGRPLPWAKRPLYATLFENQGQISRELAIRDRDGLLRPVLVTTAPVLTDAGKAIGAVAVFHDLTPVKAFETERHIAVETQARLEGVQLAAHEMSHRIINDITSAYGAFAMVADDLPLPDDARELVDNGLEGLSRAVRHIRQFSQVTKIQTRRTPAGLVLDLPPAGETAA